MNYENILFEIEENMAVVTINRPKVLNALNIATVLELKAAFTRIADDPHIQAVILTGAGEKSFVAGADIGEIHNLEATSGLEFALRGQGVLNQIQYLPKVVVAAVNGFALGGGCELAMACHVRFVSENARFGQPEVNLGVIPGYGGTQRLARLVGTGRALELCLSGDMVDANEAYRIGLANKVYPLTDLLPKAKEFCKKVISKGPLATSYVLTAINNGMEIPLPDALREEAALFGLVCGTLDMKEGTQAFLEKRPANFSGK